MGSKNGKKKKTKKKGLLTRRQVLGGAVGAAGIAVVHGGAQKLPEAVITVVRGLMGPSTGATVVSTATAVSAIVGSTAYVAAGPKPVILPLHPDDERPGP